MTKVIGKISEPHPTLGEILEQDVEVPQDNRKCYTAKTYVSVDVERDKYNKPAISWQVRKMGS